MPIVGPPLPWVNRLPAQLVRGPYLQYVTDTSATVIFKTLKSANGWVKYDSSSTFMSIRNIFNTNVVVLPNTKTVINTIDIVVKTNTFRLLK